MKLQFEDVFELEDFRTINAPEKFNRHLTVEDLELTHKVPIVIRYDYIDLNSTDYNFRQPFSHEDTVGYFTRMKEFAGKTVNSLLDHGDSFHFYRSALRGKLLDAVRKVLPQAVLTDQIIYHFSLYESDRWADRTTDSRNSRVYFMLGTYGHIYILFFDPYHELNPLTRR